MKSVKFSLLIFFFFGFVNLDGLVKLILVEFGLGKADGLVKCNLFDFSLVKLNVTNKQKKDQRQQKQPCEDWVTQLVICRKAEFCNLYCLDFFYHVIGPLEGPSAAHLKLCTG